MLEGKLKVAVGATLSTVSGKDVVEIWPMPSSAVMVTVWFSAGSSLVFNDQLHVPLLVPLLVTVPTEAVNVTALESAKVPELVAVCPSFTVTAALSLVKAGAVLSIE